MARYSDICFMIHSALRTNILHSNITSSDEIMLSMYRCGFDSAIAVCDATIFVDSRNCIAVVHINKCDGCQNPGLYFPTDDPSSIYAAVLNYIVQVMKCIDIDHVTYDIKSIEYEYESTYIALRPIIAPIDLDTSIDIILDTNLTKIDKKISRLIKALKIIHKSLSSLDL